MIPLLVFALAVDAGAVQASQATHNTVALRDAGRVLADYAKAIGDEKAWRKHKNVRVKREVLVQSMHFTSREETRIAKGGKIYSTSEMPGMGTFKRGCDGRTAWAQDPIGGLRILKNAEAADIRIAASWNAEWHLAQIYKKVTSVPPPPVVPTGQTWECVELDKGAGQPSTVCFDGTTHLRVWEKGVQASQGGEVPYVTRFADWRPVDGVLVWHKEQVTVGPVTMEGRIVEIAFDEPIRAATFMLPKTKD